ncbi:MAG: hypothetical protein PVG32_19970 [Anaerolineales bacterium]|jgi:hypothetical protein
MIKNASQPNSPSARNITLVLHIPIPKIAILVPILGILLILTTLSVLGFFDIRGVFAQGDIPDAPQSVAAFTSVGTLNFQGELRDHSSGNPLVDGDYKMRFAIYDAETSGSKYWPSPSPDYEEHTAVSLTDGLFNVSLGSHITIPGGVFENGGDRYLQIWVCPTAGTGCVDFEDLGRLPISSVGYAKTFAPGASVSGTGMILGLSSSTTDGSVLTVNASASTGNAAGVYSSSNAPSGAGLSGYNASSGYGVYGSSVSGTGVFGFAAASIGENYGIYGRNNSASGAGVYGESYNSDGVGVHGENTFGYGTGVRGDSAGGAGVYGSSENGMGVYGTSTVSGTVGIATRQTGLSYGVYGQNASANGAGVYGTSTHPNGFGVYSDGDMHVEGNLTWMPMTGYLSVPAAAFRPSDNSIDYSNDGYILWHKGSGLIENKKTFFAPVSLPHQAQLKNLSVQVCVGWTILAGKFELRLLSYDKIAGYSAAPNEIAFIISSNINQQGCITYNTDYFTPDMVDNSRYAYYLGVWMVGNNGGDTPYISLHDVMLEYQFSKPY